MKPLTPKMVELLKHIQSGATASYSPYMGRFNPQAHYYCFGLPGGSRCTTAAKGLLARGLLKKTNMKSYSSDHDLELTEAGRSFDINGTGS